MIGNLGIFFLAAFFEIFGCFAFWLYFKLERTPWWIALGVVSLVRLCYLWWNLYNSLFNMACTS